MANPVNTWPMVDPGEFRHFITIQQQSQAPDKYGQLTTSWSSIGETIASIKAASLDEKYAADQVTSKVTDTIKIWFPDFTIQPGMQVLFGSRIFRIQDVEDIDQLNVILVMKCLELSTAAGGSSGLS